MTDLTDETIKALEESDDEDQASTAPETDSEIAEAYANLSFRIIYQSNNYLLPQIRQLVEKGEILNLRPEYQRRLRWTNKQKSLLIESLFLNIPVPPIFLFENDFARYEVMDGQQRLHAIDSYLKNEFSLSNLEKLSFLNGKRYLQLPPRLTRALDRASISAIVLLQETKSDERDPYLVRRFVFERLNTGGQKLNAQEMRNSIYRGAFNKLIVDLARTKDFCSAFSIPQYMETDENEYYENAARQKNNLYKTMGDCQIVLRFFALSRDEYIVGSMQNILNKAMQRNEKASVEKIEDDRKYFTNIIAESLLIFGTNPFSIESDGRHRIAITLYDAITGALCRRSDRIEELRRHAPLLRTRIEELKRSSRDLLTGNYNTAQSIRDRINAVVRMLDAPFV